MFGRPLLLALLQCILLQNALAAPPRSFPRAYNQQAFININDINDLEADHVKRAMVDVKTTIREVQKILETDPSLPRLTRGEIEELFENVTREEFQKSLLKGDNNRAKHMRALMLVLPYNTNNYSDERLQELYTRPPVTKVVAGGEDTRPAKPQQVIQSPTISAAPGTNPTTYKPSYATKSKNQKPTTFHPKATVLYKNPIYVPKPVPTITSTSTTSSTTTTTTTSKPEKFSSHYNAERPPFNPASMPPMRANVKDLLATIGLTAEVMPTTTTQHPPELTPELRDLLNSFGLLTNEEHPKHLQYNPEIVQEEFSPIPSYSFLQDDSLHLEEFKPIPSPAYRSVTKNYRMNTAPELTADDFSAFKPLPIPEEEVITTDMEEFFKAYGLLDSSYRHKKSMYEEDKSSAAEDDRSSLSTISSYEVPSIEKEFKLPKMEKMPAVSVDFLTPGLMDVLGNIGISNSGDGYTSVALPLTRARQTYPLDIVLPEPKATDRVDTADKDEEDTKPISKYPIHVVMPIPKATDRSDTVVEDENAADLKKLQHLLETIKKLDKLNKTLTDDDIESLDLKNFNLSAALLNQFNADLDPNENSDTLFDVHKNEIKRQSEETTESQSPLRFTLNLAATTEEGFLDKDTTETTTAGNQLTTTDTSKTTVASDTADTKTSSPATSTSSTTTTSSTTARPTLLTSEERKSDLDDSFGGAGLDPVTETPLPPPRRNGFYFLADWNSFLEVGEDPDKVVVRFDPKIGDPSRFLPVTVP